MKGENTKIMTMTEMTAILETVIQQSHNDIITLSVVILIGLVVFFIPFYTLYNKSKKQNSIDAANERALYMEIVQGNTDALTSLKHSLEANNELMANTLLDVENSVIGGVNKMDKILKNQNEFIEEFAAFLQMKNLHISTVLLNWQRSQEHRKKFLIRLKTLVIKSVY